jgi:CRISPR/Cas system-associated exonuclease Cas4 (RecB family)
MTLEKYIYKWLEDINSSVNMNSDIKYFHIWIFEIEIKSFLKKNIWFSLYIFWSKNEKYDIDQGTINWDFNTNLQYCELPLSETKKKDWNLILAEVTKILNNYLMSEQYKKSIFCKSKKITTWFDDWDIVIIK